MSINNPIEYISWLILPFCVAAIAYYWYTIYAAIQFFSLPAAPIDTNFHPPITILKPLCGVEPDSYDNFTSFCQQDYPQYQVIFAVREATDPIVAIVEKIIGDFPEIDISLAIDSRVIGANLKVSNLANAVVQAKHEILLIADSDIRVRSDYLRRVVQPLAEEKVAVVTCLYKSRPKGKFAVFEALGISTDFHPSVLTARKLEGMNFAFGSTILIRKTVLDSLGGFAAIADYLADDFKLGNLPTQLGYKVFLSDYIVEHFLTTENILNFFRHQIRWYRCIRVERFWSYLGLIFTQGTVTSLFFLIATLGSLLGWTVLAIVWSTRLLLAWIVAVKCIKDSVAQKFLWLVPLRDIASFIIWFFGLIGNTVEWRGKQYKLSDDGKLVPVSGIAE